MALLYTAESKLHLKRHRSAPMALSRFERSSMSVKAASAASLASAERLAQSRAFSSLIMVSMSPFMSVNCWISSATCGK